MTKSTNGRVVVRGRPGLARARRARRPRVRIQLASSNQAPRIILHTIFHVLTEQYHVHTTTGSRVLGARIRSSSQIARMTSAFAVLPMLSVFVVNANERPA